jgi:hypothetical protein
MRRARPPAAVRARIADRARRAGCRTGRDHGRPAPDRKRAGSCRAAVESVQQPAKLAPLGWPQRLDQLFHARLFPPRAPPVPSGAADASVRPRAPARQTRRQTFSARHALPSPDRVADAFKRCRVPPSVAGAVVNSPPGRSVSREAIFEHAGIVRDHTPPTCCGVALNRHGEVVGQCSDSCSASISDSASSISLISCVAKSRSASAKARPSDSSVALS